MIKLGQDGWVKTLESIVKILIAAIPVITGFVVFDDWYERQIRLEITPFSVEVDNNAMNRYLFDVEENDRPLIREINDLDTSDYFDIGMIQARLSGLMGGKPENLTKFNLMGLNTASQFMRLYQESDSQIIRQPGQKSSQFVDSVRALTVDRGRLLPMLESMIVRYTAQLEDKKRIVVATSVLNKSGIKASLVGPAILSVTFEAETINVAMTVSNQSMAMDMMGMKVTGAGDNSIDERSHEEVRFFTETAEEIGKNWEKLVKALEQPGATGVILCYASDDSIVESVRFPFSQDYAGKRNRERRQALEETL